MAEPMYENEYSKEFSEDKFWSKTKKYAIKAGKEVIIKALTLFNTMKDRDTPAWAKSVIVGALGYFIFPIDAIPDAIPVVGYADDLGVLAAAFATVSTYVKGNHSDKAKDTWRGWFGDSEKQNEIED